MHKHRGLTFRVKRLHVYFVNFFGIILLVAPLPFASGSSVVGFLLQQVPGAVVDGDDLRGHLLGLGVLVRGAGELQFAQDLPPDRLDPLAHKLIHVEGAAGRQAESHGGQIQGEKHAQEIAVHFKCLNTAPPPKNSDFNSEQQRQKFKNKKGCVQTKGRSADKMQLKTGLQGRLAIKKRTGGVSEKNTNYY